MASAAGAFAAVGRADAGRLRELKESGWVNSGPLRVAVTFPTDANRNPPSKPCVCAGIGNINQQGLPMPTRSQRAPSHTLGPNVTQCTPQRPPTAPNRPQPPASHPTHPAERCAIVSSQ